MNCHFNLVTWSAQERLQLCFG